MPETLRPASTPAPNPWPLVLCLIGVDYFSTLAYLPSIAVQAAGALAPFAAGAVVLVTFLLALPVYWYIVGRSPDGRGAAGLLEDRIPGWRGKLIVLTLLGFVAADFVITRSLSLADAAVHLIHNPHGQRLLARIPETLIGDDHALWAPLEYLVRRIAEPQVAITLGLSILSFIFWVVLQRNIRRQLLIVTAGAVACYLALVAVVTVSALVFIARHHEIWQAWLDAAFAAGQHGAESIEPASRSRWPAWMMAILWSFPQMALGLSGFEMMMTVVPRISVGGRHESGTQKVRVRNSRKLMLTAASIMAIYLISTVLVTTLIVPTAALLPGGAAEHRSLAYLAHGSPLAVASSDSTVNPFFGHRFGDIFDLSTAVILCMAGASVTLGLQNLLPHYLNRLGMDVSWAGRFGAILVVLNAIVLVVTVVFQASPASQQWAYATSVLVLLAGAALAASKDLGATTPHRVSRWLLVALASAASGFFLVMTGLTVLINASGLAIALSFVLAILVSSFVSRWIRSTELRFEGFDFFDEATHRRWCELSRCGPKVLIPHRPGQVSLAEKCRDLQREHRLDPTTPTIFIEAKVGDPSNFYQKPLMRIEREGALEVIRVSRCVSISHVLAAICLKLCDDGGEPPEIIFGWSHEQPIAANLNFLLLGEGNIPWMVKELIRRAMPPDVRQPKIRIG